MKEKIKRCTVKMFDTKDICPKLYAKCQLHMEVGHIKFS